MPIILDPLDVSLWFAMTAVVLLLVAELLSSRYGKSEIIIERGRLRKLALLFGIFFISSVLVRALATVLRP